MSTLISDLLAYSRATTERDRITATVSLEDLLMDVLRSVKVLVDETGATVRHNGLPVVYGDPAQLRQVLQNLIVNALKYRRQEVAPEVEIGVRRNGGEWLVWVRDNGMGFAQEFSDRIFGIFKRLHGREVPGTGIGLAICKTVVERHGGRIWAESEIGKGSTFFFTLPAMDRGFAGQRRY
jgi:signal transduction histidine kinase